MKPTEKLDSARTPDGSHLTLYRHDDDYYIMQERNIIMSSRIHRSEEDLATLGCENLRTKGDARVLVGGLGLGYTAAAALALLPRTATVVVAELLEPVVRWNREILGHLAGKPLDDPRVTVRVGDVARVMLADGPFDAILLDVDNGPDSFIVADNATLYSRRGLETLRTVLRPEGTLAIWSATHVKGFTELLRKAGFKPREIACQTRDKGRMTPYVVWVATMVAPRASRTTTDKRRSPRPAAGSGKGRPSGGRPSHKPTGRASNKPSKKPSNKRPGRPPRRPRS